MADPNQSFDLGLDVSVGEGNIFEQFHKQKAEKPNEEVTFKQPETPQDDKEESVDTKQTADTKQPGDTKPPETKFNTDPNIINDLIKESLTNKETDDDDDDPEDDKTVGDKSKQTAGDKSKTEAKVVPAGIFNVLYDHFVNELGYEALADGKEIKTQEDWIEWQESVIESRIEEAASSYINEAFANQKQNAPEARDLIKFMANGGSVHDWVDARKDDDIGTDYLTVDDADIKETRSKVLLDRYYTAIGWDKTAIEKTIKTLETAGTLESMAESVLPQFDKLKTSRKAVADQTAVATKQRTDKEIREYNTQILSTIDTAKEFGTFAISSIKDKNKLKEYMFTPTEDDGAGRKVPKFILDLSQARKNPNFTLYEALVLMNNGINLKNIADKIQTRTNVSLKEKLEGQLQGNKKEQIASTGSDKQSQAQTKNVLDFDNLQFV